MTVRCAQCGEELMGAVNRCWRCGHVVPSQTGDTSLPPVRVSPTSSASAAAPEQETVANDAASDEFVIAELAPGQPQPSAEQTRRVGSPFAGGPVVRQPIAATETPPATTAPGKPRYPQNAGASGTAIASVFLGIVSLAICYLPTAALVTAGMGLGMGLWGMYSPKRSLAILGVVLCCIAIALAGFNGVVWWYEYQYGMKPWEHPLPYDPAMDGAY